MLPHPDAILAARAELLGPPLLGMWPFALGRNAAPLLTAASQYSVLGAPLECVKNWPNFWAPGEPTSSARGGGFFKGLPFGVARLTGIVDCPLAPGVELLPERSCPPVAGLDGPACVPFDC